MRFDDIMIKLLMHSMRYVVINIRIDNAVVKNLKVRLDAQERDVILWQYFAGVHVCTYSILLSGWCTLDVYTERSKSIARSVVD